MKSPYKLHRRYRRRDSYVTTLQRLYEYGTSHYYDRQMNRFSDGTGGYTYKSFKETVDALSVRLSRYGISAGDKVAILAQNMPNWTVAFFAATAFGRVAIPILPDSSESEVSNILSHSESRSSSSPSASWARSATRPARNSVWSSTSRRSISSRRTAAPSAATAGPRNRPPTTWRRSSTPPARPAPPRASC